MEKKCKRCAMMIPKEAKICSHCRKKQGMGKVAKVVLIVAGGSFMLAACLDATALRMQKSATERIKADPVKREQAWYYLAESGQCLVSNESPAERMNHDIERGLRRMRTEDMTIDGQVVQVTIWWGDKSGAWTSMDTYYKGSEGLEVCRIEVLRRAFVKETCE